MQLAPAGLRRDISIVVLFALACGWLIIRAGIAVAPVPEQLLMLTLLLLDAIAIAVAIPRASPLGVVVGVYLLGSHIIGWTVPEPGKLLGLGSVLYAGTMWTVVALRRPLHVQPLRTDFTVWLGVFPWVPAVVGALLRFQLTVGSARVVYMMAALGLVLLARRCRALPLAWGIIAGVHVALLPLFGCGLLETLPGMRFGGGGCASTHPNIVGFIGWTLGIMWLSLPVPHFLFRLAPLATSLLILAMTDSRTSVAAALVGSAVVLTSCFRTSLEGKGRFIRLAMLGLVLTAMGGGAWLIGSEFFVRERATGAGVLSGRDAIWGQTLREFMESSWGERFLGSSQGGPGARVVLPSETRGAQRKLLADNAILGVLRLGGVIGLGIGISGLVVAARLALMNLAVPRVRGPTALLIAGMATIPVESWFFGGSLWVWLVISKRLMDEASSHIED